MTTSNSRRAERAAGRSIGLSDGNAGLEKSEMLAQRRALGARITEIEQRLEKIKTAVAVLVKELRRPNATDGHSKRMHKLVKERNELLAEKLSIEKQLADIRLKNTERRGLIKSSYQGKLFNRAFVAAAEEQLEPEVFERIKQAAMQQRRDEIMELDE